MIDASTLLFGPLAGPECLRGSRRSWVIWVRMFPAIACGVVAMSSLWIWWMFQKFDPSHQPLNELRGGLALIEGMMVIFAMILSPAVLAGSLAGEKERGSIGLILTTRATSADVVLGRLAGRLTQVLMIELAALPVLLLMTAICGFGWSATLTSIALPVSVAFGGAGIALATSAMSKRGRDALLLVYLLEILILLSPMLDSFNNLSWISAINPFTSMDHLLTDEDFGPALITSAIWTVLGVASLALASWRLRPACLSDGSDAKDRKKARRKRHGWVPPIDDRPMLWKELYIERAGTLGRAGRWIGGALILALALGSVTFAMLGGLDYWRGTSEGWADWATQQLSFWYGNSGWFLVLLIEGAIGLRASVAISSERERGTWDALLTSPLEDIEIIRGKLWGSLHALRWLAGSAILAWTITLIFSGMLTQEYVFLLMEVVILGAFMAAIGVRTSLRSATATKAMGITAGIYVAAYLLALAIAALVCLVVVCLCVFGWLIAAQSGFTTFSTRPWFPMGFQLGSNLVFFTVFVVATVLIVLETRLRFDRVAGRMIGGKTAIAFDAMIHGRPMAPVQLDGKRKAKSEVLAEL